MRYENDGPRVLRVADMCRALGVGSRTTLYRYEKAGVIPRRRQIGPGLVGWLSDEVADWLKSRPVVERGEL